MIGLILLIMLIISPETFMTVVQEYRLIVLVLLLFDLLCLVGREGRQGQ